MINGFTLVFLWPVDLISYSVTQCCLPAQLSSWHYQQYGGSNVCAWGWILVGENETKKLQKVQPITEGGELQRRPKLLNGNDDTKQVPCHLQYVSTCFLGLHPLMDRHNLCLDGFALQNVFSDWQQRGLLDLKARSDLLQNLHVNTVPRWSVCTGKLSSTGLQTHTLKNNLS